MSKNRIEKNLGKQHIEDATRRSKMHKKAKAHPMLIYVVLGCVRWQLVVGS